MIVEVPPHVVTMPVFSVVEKEPGVFDSTSEVAGTCFLLGEGFFITAGHVVGGIVSSGRKAAIGAPVPGADTTVAILSTVDTEVMGLDIGLIQVATTREITPPESEFALPWAESGIGLLDPVWTIGFPHGTQALRARIHLLQRAFSGHVVAGPITFEPPSRDIGPFGAFELSFQAPRGLSGAPLLSGARPSAGPNVVHGIVTGNAAVQMLVHREQYKEVGTGCERVIEQYESLSFGLAVTSTEIMALSSRLLGSTVREYLSKRGRLIVEAMGRST